MGSRDVVEAFVTAINSGHAERVHALMSRNHVFIDSLGARFEGREAMLAGWRAYLKLFPDYRIEVDAMFGEEEEIMLHGRASATLHRNARPVEGGRWEIPAAWRAIADRRAVSLWQVYADNKSVYALLERG